PAARALPRPPPRCAAPPPRRPEARPRHRRGGAAPRATPTARASPRASRPRDAKLPHPESASPPPTTTLPPPTPPPPPPPPSRPGPASAAPLLARPSRRSWTAVSRDVPPSFGSISHVTRLGSSAAISSSYRESHSCTRRRGGSYSSTASSPQLSPPGPYARC